MGISRLNRAGQEGDGCRWWKIFPPEDAGKGDWQSVHQQHINHCHSPPWEHQGLSTALYPAQMDINNSAFSSQREKSPLSSAVPQSKRESSRAVALLVTPTQTSPLSDLSKPLVLPNLQTGGFLCVQGIVSSRGVQQGQRQSPRDGTGILPQSDKKYSGEW